MSQAIEWSYEGPGWGASGNTNGFAWGAAVSEVAPGAWAASVTYGPRTSNWPYTAYFDASSEDDAKRAVQRFVDSFGETEKP